MPVRVGFELSMQPPGQASGVNRGPAAVRRLLLLGNFSGQPATDRTPLALRPTHRVDLDNLDTVLARLTPHLTLKLGQDSHALAFACLEDFDAESLLLHSEPLNRLSQLVTQLKNPASFAKAAAAWMGWGTQTADQAVRSLADLLGGQVTAPPSPANAASLASGIDAFIRQVVASPAEPAAPPQQTAFVAATQSALSLSLRALLHHPELQALEALWRGVAWLLSTLELDETLELHLLDVTCEELLQDADQADGQAIAMQLTAALKANSGGGPKAWSALLGLRSFDNSAQDLGLLGALGRVAQATRAPFVAGAGASLLAAMLRQTSPAGAAQPDLTHWQVLRRSEVANWIGLAAPRLLMRVPYGRGGQHVPGLEFEETDSASDPECYLWGPAALACAWAWVQPPGSNTIDGLPGWSVRRNGEVEQLPCAEHWLSDTDWQALLQAGVMPLVSHAGRHAVQLPRLQSVAQPARALGGT